MGSFGILDEVSFALVIVFSFFLIISAGHHFLNPEINPFFKFLKLYIYIYMNGS